MENGQDTGKFPLFVLLLFIIFNISCTQKLTVDQFANNKKNEETVITALPPLPVSEAEPLSDSNMVLESGNYWTIGIPGFGENALSAFVGEYRIPGKTKTVRVWLTGEFIYYNGWTGRSSITNIPVREKMGNEGRIVASAMNENWIVVMLLPLDEGLSEQDENRIIVNLINKFSGIAGGQNISFPALVAY